MIKTQSIHKSDFDRICRTCLAETDNTFSIFSSGVREKLKYFLSLQIESNDCLPSIVCGICSEIINKSYNFKKVCENSDRLLRNILEQTDDDDRSNDLYCKTVKLEYDIDNSNNQIEKIDIKNLYYSSDTTNTLTSADNLILKTDNCEREFVETDKYVQNTEKRTYGCNECSKEFGSISNLASHMVSVHLIEPVTCKICNKKFRIPLQLALHERKHARKYECTQCNKVFASAHRLRRHKKIHTVRKRNFMCLSCDKTFLEEDNLKRHNSMYHEGRMKRKPCNICGKSFLSLKSHMQQKHATERPFECEQCSKTYPTRHQLKQHKRRIHEGCSPAKTTLCATCGERFVSRATLIRHSAVHSEERPFECTDCGRKYKWITSLKIHSKTHTGFRPHACTFCDKRFYTMKTLEHHMHTHTGERPYVCELCGSTFAHSGPYYTHKKSHPYNSRQLKSK